MSYRTDVSKADPNTSIIYKCLSVIPPVVCKNGSKSFMRFHERDLLSLCVIYNKRQSEMN